MVEFIGFALRRIIMRVKIEFVKNVDKALLKTLLEISRHDGSAPVSKTWLKKISEHDVFFVAMVNVSDRKAVRYAGFAAVDPWFKYDKNGIELDIISVKKEFQRKGIGTELMRAVENYIKKLGKRFVYLAVRASNTKALRFYAKLGFEVAGLLADRYGAGKHSIFMRKATN